MACSAEILAHVTLDIASVIPESDGSFTVNTVNDGFNPYNSGNALGIEVHELADFSGLFEASWFYQF